MKRKLITLSLLALLSFAFVSCDLLSTINAVTGFYSEYQNFSDVYSNATQYTVLTETELSISDTNIADLVPLDTRVYFMFDENSDFLYVEQNLEGTNETSVYENANDLYVEYMIDENNVVVPRLPTAEEQFAGNTSANILNENFSYEDVTNENKTGDRTYELDVVLTQAINLDVLGDFIDQLRVFDENLSSLDDVIAHLVITFDTVDSTIDVTTTVTNYTITFDDDSTVTFSLTNHTVLKIPDNFEMPNVFADPYHMVAVDNIALARRVYEASDEIAYPVVADQGGWVQLNLEAGDYNLVSDSNDFIASMFDADQTPIDWNVTGDSSYQVTIPAAGTYYVYVTPTADSALLSYMFINNVDASGTVTSTTVTTSVTTE